MYGSEDQRALFGMPDRGKRKLNLGKASTVDTIILGRDLDQSGDDPHKDFMKKFSDHAGMASGTGDAEQRPFRRAGISQCSQMDEIIYGHDIDTSGFNPHEEFMKRFGEHAGTRSQETQHNPFRKPGMAHSSVMDDILYGHDIDSSGADPHGDFMQKFGKHAGKKSAEKADRPFRKPGMAAASCMDTVIYGHDIDQSGDDPHEVHMRRFATHAGKKSENKDPAPFRRCGIAHHSVMNNVIYGDSTQVDAMAVFKSKYGGYAGCSWKTKRPPKQWSDAGSEAPHANGLRTPSEAGNGMKTPSEAGLGQNLRSGTGDENGVPAAALADKLELAQQESNENELPSQTLKVFMPPSRTSPAGSAAASERQSEQEMTLKVRPLALDSPPMTPNPAQESIIPQRVNPFGGLSRSPSGPGSRRGSATPSVCGSVCSDKPRWR